MNHPILFGIAVTLVSVLFVTVVSQCALASATLGFGNTSNELSISDLDVEEVV
jgi:hypothetical protein